MKTSDNLRVDGTRNRLMAARPRPAIAPVAKEMRADAYAKTEVAPRGAGYLYGILFNTGAIKIGQTSDMHQRFQQHRRDARPFGAYPIEAWVIGSYINHIVDEAVVLEFCALRGTRTRQEYFQGVDFHETFTYAMSLQVRPEGRTQC